MRIVIDMQGVQTDSRFRGIGRYTLAFAQAVVRNKEAHEVILALSGLFPDTIEPIRAAFDGLLPQSNIRVWQVPGPVREAEVGNDARRGTAELLREAFLASLQPDVIHITSLFEGYVDNAVTSIGLLDDSTPVSVILYDLIPLQNPDQYLKSNLQYEQYYLRKIESLRKATVFLAISEFTRQEGIEVLELNNNQVVNISAAIDKIFKPINVEDSTRKILLQKYGIWDSFVLYTGGSDGRKNLLRLVQAYAQLPQDLRAMHQLVFVGVMGEEDLALLKDTAKKCGLHHDTLVFAGYVSEEELVQLYNLCVLYVFPSWHEGFGLPALEAMACGAPVIGANTSSLPEVIGFPEALFDPLDVASISRKMNEALEDQEFRSRLREHGLQQAKKFSWDETAIRAIKSWEALPQRSLHVNRYLNQSTAHEKFINALVPRVDAYDESALIALADSIAKNESAGIERQLLVDVSELCQHDAATGVQRVVRSYLKWLLQSPPPGFRVEPVYATLDDGYRYARRFTTRFLEIDSSPVSDGMVNWQRGDVFFGLDMQHNVQLAHAKFYAKLKQKGVVVKFLVHDLLPIELPDLFKDSEAKELHEQWLAMIAKTDEAICVSKATAEAYDAWLKDELVDRAPRFTTSWVHNGGDIEGSKPSLGLPKDAATVIGALRNRLSFLCVSTIEPRKQQHQILGAFEELWKQGVDVNLIFVGKPGWKAEPLINRLLAHPEINKRLFWLQGISDEYLEQVYAASTCLIAASLNEGFGLSLIEAARHRIPIIARDIPVFREVAGDHAFYFKGEQPLNLAMALNDWLNQFNNKQHPSSNYVSWSTWKQSTEKLKVSLLEQNCPQKQFLVDISELVQRDSKTGIQRVVRSVLKEWLLNPPEGYRVEPVYATVEQGYRYAKKYTAKFIGLSEPDQTEEFIEYTPGDVFFGLDLNHHVPRVHRTFLYEMHTRGVDVRFMVYDLLPIQFPEFWETEHSVPMVVEEWMSVITSLGGAVCISKAVAEDLAEWVSKNGPKRQRAFSIKWFHLGADINQSVPTKGFPLDWETTIKQIHKRPTFVMVGTLEPRKGHWQVLDAFELMWAKGLDINLIIVGKKGWLIDELIDRLGSHQEAQNRLFWLETISDECLEEVYARSTCLIASSYGEGFGLPLIEAAQHKLHIIARDIPVFREVAGKHAYYFDGKEPIVLAEAVEAWLRLFKAGTHPSSHDMPWLTWKESSENLLEKICNESRE